MRSRAGFSSRVFFVLAVVSVVVVPSTPAAAHGPLCSSWEQWVYSNTYSVILRSCINHGSVVTARTEAYLEWSALPPEFDYFSLTTQLRKNGSTVSSDVCNRTTAANDPADHNTPGEAMICLVSLDIASGTWSGRSASCLDPLIPDFDWYRCSTDDRPAYPGWVVSPTHSL